MLMVEQVWSVECPVSSDTPHSLLDTRHSYYNVVMSLASWSPFLIGLWVCALLAPPLGLLILWLKPQTLARKIIGTLGILLYSLLYAALIIWLLIEFTGLQIEWRGGYVPALTYHKTVPNY